MQIFGISGPSGSGKTRVVEKLLQELSVVGFSCLGLYSPAVFENGVKTGINTRRIPGGETRTLARLAKPGDTNTVGKWWIDPDTITWAADYLNKQLACDAWIVDEIGPMEIEQQRGWHAVLKGLYTYPCQAAIITYRPAYRIYFSMKYPGIINFSLEEPESEKRVVATILAHLTSHKSGHSTAY